MFKLFLVAIFIFLFNFVSFGQSEVPKITGNGNGTGTGRGNGTGSGNGDNVPARIDEPKPQPEAITSKTNRGIIIISKPQVNYTDVARRNQVQGKVVLSVTFKKNGKIGKVEVVAGLPDGLSQNAVEAAKNIKFTPQIKNGKPVTITKKVEYTFTIY